MRNGTAYDLSADRTCFSILLRIVELAVEPLLPPRSTKASFSILLRIVELAETITIADDSRYYCFSILLRIVELAGTSAPGRHAWLSLFQYPLADRRACGAIKEAIIADLTSFSILLRIVELAVPAARGCGSGGQRFSILLRIVELAGETPGLIKPNMPVFQYPLADRRACGSQRGILRPSRHGFSILLRIVELAATSTATMPLRLSFQYPLADRRACGSRAIRIAPLHSVSVSSCGS